MSIHKTAQLGIGVSETQLRVMVKQKKCPGVYSGRKFLVNVDALVEQLDTESRSITSGTDDGQTEGKHG